MREPATAVDAYVGRRIAQARRIVGMSQKKLAEKLGLTYGPIQHYERGRNRICISRLYEISIILQVPVSYFFEGLPGMRPPVKK